MEKVTFSIPAMWADHHVLAVRETLSQINGVGDILASAMYKDVVVQYDPEATDPTALTQTLSQAGYEIARTPQIPTYPPRIDDTSDWFRLQDRITETNMLDLEMSGDHRQY